MWIIKLKRYKLSVQGLYTRIVAMQLGVRVEKRVRMTNIIS